MPTAAGGSCIEMTLVTVTAGGAFRRPRSSTATLLEVEFATSAKFRVVFPTWTVAAATLLGPEFGQGVVVPDTAPAAEVQMDRTRTVGVAGFRSITVISFEHWFATTAKPAAGLTATSDG